MWVKCDVDIREIFHLQASFYCVELLQPELPLENPEKSNFEMALKKRKVCPLSDTQGMALAPGCKTAAFPEISHGNTLTGQAVGGEQ